MATTNLAPQLVETITSLRNRMPRGTTNIMDVATPEELTAIREAVTEREVAGDRMIGMIKRGLVSFGMQF